MGSEDRQTQRILREQAEARALGEKMLADKLRAEEAARFALDSDRNIGGNSMADTTTAHTILRQAPYIEEQQRRLLDFAEGVSNLPITLPEQQVAGFDPLTTAAFTTGLILLF